MASLRNETTMVTLDIQEFTRNTGLDNQKVLIEDLKTVHKYLSMISTKWYTIGVCLGVSISRLRAMEQDYTTTDRRLLAMIEEWINTGKATWSDLIDALRQRSFTSPKSDPKTEIELLSSKKSFGKEDAEVVTSYQVIYNIMCSQIMKSCNSNLNHIRNAFTVPDTISDEKMLCSITSYSFWSNTSELLTLFSQGISEIATLLQHDRKCLSIWVNYMMSETEEVTKKINELAMLKDRLKESLFKKETGRGIHAPMQDTGTHLQAQEFLETVQDIQEFSDALCFRLKACEEKAKNSRDKNKIYKNAANITHKNILLISINFYLLNFTCSLLFMNIYIHIYQSFPTTHMALLSS